MPIDGIDGKSHKAGTEKQPQLFNQSYKAEIMSLVIYGHWVYTHTHTYIPVMKVISRNQAHAWFKNIKLRRCKVAPLKILVTALLEGIDLFIAVIR